MGRHTLLPRLQWYRRKGRDPVLIIVHRTKRFSTSTSDPTKAEAKLREYIASPKYFRTRQLGRRGRLRPDDVVWLYFIEVAAEDRPIKIGIATNVRARQWNLGVGCPFDLNLLAAVKIERATEKVLHKRLEGSRIRGEWYKRTPDVEAAIAAAASSEFDAFIDGASAVAEAARKVQREKNLVRFAKRA